MSLRAEIPFKTSRYSKQILREVGPCQTLHYVLTNEISIGGFFYV